MINQIMRIFIALICSLVVVYIAHEHNLPAKLFYHDKYCTGAIGGGCE